MYYKLIELIENEKNKNIIKELTIIKNRINRGENARSTIYESYVCMKEMITAPINSKYKTTLEHTIKIIEENLLPLIESEKEQENKDKVIKDIMSNNNNLRKESLKNAKVDDEIPDFLLEKKDENIKELDSDEINHNNIAILLKVCAAAEGIIGYLIGVSMLYFYITSRVYFSFLTIIIYFTFIAILICFTLGFSELIQLLADIRKKLLK